MNEKIDKDYKNRYKHRSIKWALCNEDFSDLTVAQIAEVFGTTEWGVRAFMAKIKRDTGFIVPYKKLR